METFGNILFNACGSNNNVVVIAKIPKLIILDLNLFFLTLVKKMPITNGKERYTATGKNPPEVIESVYSIAEITRYGNLYTFKNFIKKPKLKKRKNNQENIMKEPPTNCDKKRGSMIVPYIKPIKTENNFLFVNWLTKKKILKLGKKIKEKYTNEEA